MAPLKKSTITVHYFNFTASSLDILDKHKEFKGHYIVMDDALIHMAESIEKYVVICCYGYI
ncbi:hypothetical protein RO3G_16496 [Rhizopus delemar RA 99-880]|uniref:DDE-1 domain-containing protein n=1 Tax=Rhizopus delemar (strain RA 99-880 / ATCC MYA-4621 / FGSC 9543 / NRRL 43880) TaxID=246409 RepID=I1CTK5_RHIO9|nr:hypothetical protein RO3G_16496 [Rhizopus delemar RA 99-880]|eukprot:EIE91785.1 hypothetical protein RO3G_16496 [Rhizopus delemar RA 99-880]